MGYNEELENQIEIYKKKNNELEEINRQVTENFHQIREALIATKKDVESMKSRFEGEGAILPKEKQALLEKVTKLEKENVSLYHELISVRQLLAAAHNERDADLEQENDRLREDVSKLQEEVSKLKK